MANKAIGPILAKAYHSRLLLSLRGASINLKLCQNNSNSSEVLKVNPRDLNEARDPRVLLRKTDEESNEDKSNLFPVLRQLNIDTDNRKHTVTISCEEVLKFIKFGAINKNLAIQYCHFIASVARKHKDQEDHEYYLDILVKMMVYLVKNVKEVPLSTRIALICDLSDVSKRNCIQACKLLLDSSEMLNGIKVAELTQILNTCYGFDQWEICDRLLEQRRGSQRFSFNVYDALFEFFHRSSIKYQVMLDPSEKKRFRDSIFNHLYKVIDTTYKDRVPIVTNHSTLLEKSLENFHVETKISPFIKPRGRCTNCGSKLPVLDTSNLKNLNINIRELINEKIANLSMNSTPEEFKRFESLLQSLNSNGKRIDLVIDGLNIAYRHNDALVKTKLPMGDNTNKIRRRQNVSSSVTVFINTLINGNVTEEFKNILVIGKKHMHSWPGLIDFFQKHQINYFFTSDSSQDDLFMLYASTMNPNTFILSCDLLRDHLHNLTPENHIFCERFLDTRQGWILAKTLKPIWPTYYEKLPSYDEGKGILHLPIIHKQRYRMANNAPPPWLNSKMLTWYCCRIMPELQSPIIKPEQGDPFLNDVLANLMIGQQKS